MTSRLRNRLFISCQKDLGRLEGCSDPSRSGIPGSALGPRDSYRDTPCGFLQSLPVSAWVKVKLGQHHFVTYAVDGNVQLCTVLHIFIWHNVQLCTVLHIFIWYNVQLCTVLHIFIWHNVQLCTVLHIFIWHNVQLCTVLHIFICHNVQLCTVLHIFIWHTEKVQWISKFVSSYFRDFGLPWSPVLLQFISPFVTFRRIGLKRQSWHVGLSTVLLLPKISGSQSFSVHGDLCASATFLRRP